MNRLPSHPVLQPSSYCLAVVRELCAAAAEMDDTRRCRAVVPLDVFGDADYQQTASGLQLVSAEVCTWTAFGFSTPEHIGVNTAYHNSSSRSHIRHTTVWKEHESIN